MDWRGLFTMQHRQVHSGALAEDDGDFHIPDMVVLGMSEEQLRCRPRDDQNSVVWLLWHIARCEDVVGGAILSTDGQVLDDGWEDALGVARRDIGTGMTPAEVHDLSQRIDIDALLEYRLTVGRRTTDLLDRLDDESLGRPVTPDSIDTLRALETFGAHAGWVGDYWETRT